jgi:predicted TPR repeat methyltransferase
VIVYIGALERLLLGVKSMLRTGGAFVFGIETPTAETERFRLMPSGRYQHALTYVDKTARDLGFTVLSATPCELREEGGVQVMGATILLQAP